MIITDGHPLLSNNERFGCRVAAPAAGSRPKRGTKASAVCRQLGMRLLDSTRVARTSYVAALREARDQEPIAIRENPIVLSIDTWRTLTAINSSPPPPSVPPIAESHSQIPRVYQHPVVSRRILTLPNQRETSRNKHNATVSVMQSSLCLLAPTRHTNVIQPRPGPTPGRYSAP